MGLTSGKTIFGREIKCYNLERTICDIIRSRNQFDIAIVTDTIKGVPVSKETIRVMFDKTKPENRYYYG